MIAVHTRYVDTVKDHVREGQLHSVSRSSIVKDVVALHSTEATCSEYPFQVKFVGETGIDFGGVTRDMYCTFWESAYESYFDGSNVMVPLMQAGMHGSDYLRAVWQDASTWLSVFVVAPYSNCLPHPSLQPHFTNCHHLQSNPSLDVP